MDRIRKFSGGLVALLILVFPSCGKNRQEQVEAAVAERVAEFQQKQVQTCRVELLTEAEKIVDSLLLHEALQEVTDSLNRVRPARPLPPPAIPPIDSTGIQPIFE
ncbi:MAG: hypothetical protein EP344_14225 [Bacteroidetes bacterium]|nr:MAG: hypothetical protein EP344_14225 [Bacteroidota bacterium]